MVVFSIHRHESATGPHMSPHPEALSDVPPLPIPLCCPGAPALSALLHASKLHWSSILHIVIHVSMLFSHIFPPSPSPTWSKSQFFTSVSLLLPCISDHHYRLSKFYIYALIYCIDVFFLTYFTLYNRLQFHPLN